MGSGGWEEGVGQGAAAGVQHKQAASGVLVQAGGVSVQDLLQKVVQLHVDA